MIVIPDLFGSYQKGREEAIKNNWNDLTQYESIESSRHQNDAQALANLATMADFGVRRRMVQNEGTNSDFDTQLKGAQMPAKLNIAEGDARYTGMQLGTMKANEDAIRQALANQLSTYVLGAETGYNNAVVGHGKSTMGRGIFELNYPDMFDAYNSKARADIDMTKAYSQHMPTITRNNYRGQVYSSAGAADAAEVDYKYTIPLTVAKNIAGITGHQASAAGSDLSYQTTIGEIAKLPYTFTGNANSDIFKLQELQKGLDPNSGEYKTLQGAIDNIRNGNKAVMGALGYDGISTSYFAPTPPSATSGGTSNSGTPNSTGTRTVVDVATGRAIQVPTTPANLFGTSTPTTTGTRAVVTNNVMGGHNYGGTVSNWEALMNSDAGRFIQNLFTYNPNNGGGVVGLGIPQVRQAK